VVDRWLIHNRPRQNHARPFLLWTATNGLAPAHVAIGTSSHTGNREIMSDTDRVLLAVKLETDDTLAQADRVAGCLVLRYGPSCWRLVNLATVPRDAPRPAHDLGRPAEPTPQAGCPQRTHRRNGESAGTKASRTGQPKPP
jgi:hypothetical protein